MSTTSDAKSQPVAGQVDRELGPPLEDALRRAYYYTDTGAWRGPLTEESDRWRAVAKVAAEQVTAERERWTEAVMAELDGNGQAHAIVAYATRA